MIQNIIFFLFRATRQCSGFIPGVLGTELGLSHARQMPYTFYCALAPNISFSKQQKVNVLNHSKFVTEQMGVWNGNSDMLEHI